MDKVFRVRSGDGPPFAEVTGVIGYVHVVLFHRLDPYTMHITTQEADDLAQALIRAVADVKPSTNRCGGCGGILPARNLFCGVCGVKP